ncbi:hypothetical protein F4818DRAFT_354419 [Hypoxylon cercidicola]|nr:hypothetical protein F4818DRAFT_354419 [Hypoxylon cercidicola]
MADDNVNGIEKGAVGEATVPESQPSLPPVTKGPMNTGEESVEPSIATNTATADTKTAASSEPAAQTDPATIGAKEELTEKLEVADKLASQPEKPADNVPKQPDATETATTNGPSLPNGESKKPPKPVTIEEIRDQDMPAAPPAQPTEMTGALPVNNPSDDAAKAEPVQATTEIDKTEATIGDKRKASDAEASNGDTVTQEPLEEAPAEKKQKTNGATTNGAPRKVGRPRKEKKEKKTQPAVGRAARKTRSQGAAD